ncbi:MAG TPA: HRDC domain-containing protein [Gemmatimonadaceae bacterium]|nr:HRDC domain-containing protein [Gemmatimonadaceae bacterium]
MHTPIYLDRSSDVDTFLASIGTVSRIALDTEGASFHRFVDRIYLLQLSTREQTAIIDPVPIGSPATLGRLLEDAAVEVVFHDADYDLRLLWQDYGWHVRNIFDTRVAAQLLGIRAFGLAALLERYFGVKLDKKFQRADWSMRPLSQGMLDYAAQDTIHLLELRDRMEHDLEQAGRLEWAREEFSLLEGTRWPEDEPANAFMRIKGARDLTRRELAVFRELIPWRDEIARHLDRATFRVIGNEQLLEIARRQPKTRDELAAIKGVPRGLLESRANELLDAIARGVVVPESALPRFPKAPRWDRDAEFDARVSALKTVRDATATRLDLDPGVLCSRDRLEAVARANPATHEALETVQELRAWQRVLLGEDFLKALRGMRRAAKPEPAAKPESPATSESDESDESPYRPM